ncbi:spore photoproduct lyase family protein [Pseudarthrobacter sp. Fe7]|nr:spore photoproduct lyase family protein [Pseudarthrobacter sp. Fe7]
MEFDRLLQIRRIYAQPAALELPRGREVVARWPGADVVPVENHWNIPDLHGDETNVPRWSRIKTEALVLGVKKSLTVKPNGRSADFIAPSTANGCAMACAYCYVPRHKGYSNPVTVFANLDQIAGTLERHATRQGLKLEPNQCDPELWVYDIGENSDCSVDALISDNVEDLVTLFRELPNAKVSFATKFVNPQMLSWNHGGHTRIRFSLMPADLAKSVDVRTSPVAERLAAINEFVDAGYEVHVNFSPVIITDTWLADWEDLLRQPGRNPDTGCQGSASGRGHFPDPQRATPRGKPGLASAGRKRLVASGSPGSQSLVERFQQCPVPGARQGRLRAATHGPDWQDRAILPDPLRVLGTVLPNAARSAQRQLACSVRCPSPATGGAASL